MNLVVGGSANALPVLLKGLAVLGFARHLPPAFILVAVAWLGISGCDRGGRPADDGVDDFVLDPGQDTEREIAAQGAHAYAVDLTAGDYLDVVADQHSVDVVLRLLDPEGRQLAEVDSAGIRRPERLEAMATATGTHRIVVEPWKQSQGRYAIRLEARRAATPADRSRLAARQAFAEAESLRRQNLAETRVAALARYEEALRLWRLCDDPSGQITVLRQLGRLQVRLGELEGARKSLETGLSTAAGHGFRQEEADLLVQLGSVYRRTGETERAFDAFDEAQEIARETDDRRVETLALNSLGLLYQSHGDLWAALRAFDHALEGWRELGESASEAVTLHNVGQLYTQLGCTPEAFDALRRALELRRAQGDADGEAATLSQIGWAYVSAGDAEAGLPYFRTALERKREAGDRLGEAGVLDRLGTAYRELGRLAEAQEVQEEALAIVREAGNRPGEAHSLTNLGKLQEERGELEKALRLYGEAIPIFREVEDPYGEAHALFRRAHAERRLGRPEKAREAIEAAIELVEALRAAAASPALKASYFADAHKHYAFYVDLLMEMHDADPGRGYQALALETAERGRARNLLESLTERPDTAGEARKRLRTLRTTINTTERERLRLAAQGGTPDEVEHLAAKVRTLLAEADKLKVASSGPAAGGEAAKPITVAEAREQLLDEETLLLFYVLGEEGSFLGLVSPSEVTVRKLPRRAELEAEAVQLHQLLSKSHKRGSESQAALVASRLGETLLRPVADRLAGHRLLVVADGALQLVPFAALPIPGAHGEPLVAAHEIVRLPSASVLPAIRRRAVETAPPGLLAVLADPVFSREDPRFRPGHEADTPAPEDADIERAARDLGLTEFARLPHTRSEADAILALLPAEKTYRAFGWEANRRSVLDGNLAGYRIVHFATHGLLHPVHTELSGLVLSLFDAGGNPQDGFLRAHEIAALDLPAELVVLSACRTALGESLPGEGLLGLPRAFFRAGAKRVLVSLWNVSDPGTAELMRRFYRGMLLEGLRPAEALRTAQLALLAEPKWRAPYYWAGFVLEGEWK